jgi:uncharacterized membrane protein
MDAGFTQHRLLTMIHMAPGLLFMLLGPFQFVRSLRNRRPALHRWMGRIFLVCGLIVGITALVMGPQMAIGGTTETAATMVFATLLLVSLTQAYLAIRRRQIARHREWMIRAFAIGLAVSTVRPIVGVFFATRAITHLTVHDFFGIAFWIGFTLHLAAAEVWIRWREVGPQRANVNL